MMLRQKAVVAGLLVALPAAAAVTWAVERLRANDRERAVRWMVESQINDQVRERCESDPMWFLTGPLVGRPPGGIFIETLRDPLPPRPEVQPQPFELFAYDEDFVGSSSATPRLDAEFRRMLRFGTEPVTAPHVTASGTGVQVGMATGWTGGPCAYFVGRMEAPPHQRRQTWLTALGVFGVTFLAALTAGSPVVLRVRRLARDARESADSGHTPIAPDQSSDELSSVTFVLNDASQTLRELRARTSDLDDALGRFVRTTSESVVQPLTTLEDQLATAAAASAPSLDAIQDALRLAHDISIATGNLMAATRLRRRDLPPERHRVDLRTVVDRVTGRQAPIARADGVVMHVKVPDQPVLVEVDETLMERALANLVDNAVRYNRRGGEVTVGLDRDDNGGSRFRLWVLDTGPGVSDEHFRGLTSIRRFRGDEGRSRRPGTPGLGLAIVREYCDREGFSFDLKRPGAGGIEAEISGPA